MRGGWQAWGAGRGQLSAVPLKELGLSREGERVPGGLYARECCDH